MNNFQEQFKAYITKKALFADTDPLLVAVSGGADSVVLAHLLWKSGYKIALAHCNFNLRGDASEADAALVADYSDKFDCPFYTKTFDVRGVAEASGESIQMTARRLRYEWFKQVAEEEGFNYIATAHHKRDLVESVLMNMLRGTGIRGYTGILPKTDNVVRPMLFASKEEVIRYANEEGLEWREDASNAEVHYERNFLRHNVLPELEKINPDLENVFTRNAERIYQVFRVFLKAVDEQAGECMIKDGDRVWIDTEKVAKLEAPEAYLAEWLRPFGFSYARMEMVIELLKSQSGKQVQTNDYVLYKDRGYLLLMPRKQRPSDSTVSVDDPGQTYYFADYRFHMEIKAATEIDELNVAGKVFFDYEKLEFPLLLRYVREGDYFYMLGLGKRKKVSDLLIDEKVPLPDKEKVCVLESKGKIVWIPGFRQDERFRVDEQSQRILVCSFEKSSGS